MAYTGRKKFIAIEDAYHGDSLATMSVGSGLDEPVLRTSRVAPPPSFPR